MLIVKLLFFKAFLFIDSAPASLQTVQPKAENISRYKLELFLFGHKRILCPKDCPPVLPLTPLLSYIPFGPINTSNTAPFCVAWVVSLHWCCSDFGIRFTKLFFIEKRIASSIFTVVSCRSFQDFENSVFSIFTLPCDTCVRHRLIDAVPLLHCGFESGPAPLSHVILHSLPIFPVCVIYLSRHDKKQTHIHCPLSVPNRSEVQK